MKLKATGKKITEPDITHVSLVKDPANGAPIKILRNTRNTPMKFNLAALAGAASSMPLAIFVAQKSFEQYKPLLVEQGYDLSKQEVIDGTIVIKMAPFEEDQVDAIHVADDMVFVVHKFLDPFKPGLNFNERVEATGFMPTVRGAVEAYLDGMYDAISESDNPTELSTAVDSIGKDLNDYITDLAGALPVSAFTVMRSLDKQALKDGDDKIDAQALLDQGNAGKPVDGETVNLGDGETELPPAGDEAPAKGESTAKDEGEEEEETEAEETESEETETETEAEETETEAEAEPTEAEAKAEAEKQPKAASANKKASKKKEVDPSLAEMLTAVTVLTDTVTKLAEGQKAITDRLDGVEKTAKSLRGATAATADSDADDAPDNVHQLRRNIEFGGLPVAAETPMPDSFWSGTGLNS